MRCALCSVYQQGRECMCVPRSMEHPSHQPHQKRHSRSRPWEGMQLWNSHLDTRTYHPPPTHPPNMGGTRRGDVVVSIDRRRHCVAWLRAETLVERSLQRRLLWQWCKRPLPVVDNTCELGSRCECTVTHPVLMIRGMQLLAPSSVSLAAMASGPPASTALSYPTQG